MLNSLFPPMSRKDRIMGLIGMLLYVCIGLFPLTIVSLIGFADLESEFDPHIIFIIRFLAGLGSGLFAWAWLFEGGTKMITKTPRQGLHQGDSQPWKHNGGWE